MLNLDTVVNAGLAQYLAARYSDRAVRLIGLDVSSLPSVHPVAIPPARRAAPNEHVVTLRPARLSQHPRCVTFRVVCYCDPRLPDTFTFDLNRWSVDSVTLGLFNEGSPLGQNLTFHVRAGELIPTWLDNDDLARFLAYSRSVQDLHHFLEDYFRQHPELGPWRDDLA